MNDDELWLMVMIKKNEEWLMVMMNDDELCDGDYDVYEWWLWLMMFMNDDDGWWLW